MARTIVIAVEPDTEGRVASVGLELARGLDARLVLTHVLKDREHARARNERSGRRVLDGLHASLPPDVDVEKRVEHGGVVSKLSEVAKDVGAALIVAGSRGRGPIASALFGSISRTLAREAPCPVMIVPALPEVHHAVFDAPPGERATMVAATDGSAPSSAAARFARALAEGLDQRLVVVQLRVRGGYRTEELQAIVAIENARMIVVAADYRDGHRFRFRRSFAGGLLRCGRCPVTVVPTGATTTLGATTGALGAAPESATGG